MEKYKPYLVKPNIDTGSPRDFDKLRVGYQLVERYRIALNEAERAPMYYAVSYNEDGEPKDITENLAPWEEVDEIAGELYANRAAVRILKAQKLTIEQVILEGGIVIRNPEGELVRSREIAILMNEKQQSRQRREVRPAR